MVICLERGADLHIAQLMPLPFTVSCFTDSLKSRLVLPFWYWLTRVGPLNRCVCVCVVVYFFWLVNACFYCVRFSFFHAKPRDWLGETSPKWPILCGVGHKTTTQSVSVWQSLICVFLLSKTELLPQSTTLVCCRCIVCTYMYTLG